MNLEMGENERETEIVNERVLHELELEFLYLYKTINVCRVFFLFVASCSVRMYCPIDIKYSPCFNF